MDLSETQTRASEIKEYLDLLDLTQEIDMLHLTDVSTKSSRTVIAQPYRHLIDEQKCAQTEHRYGPITGKFVLCRGVIQVVENIQYQNMEEYLRSLAS